MNAILNRLQTGNPRAAKYLRGLRILGITLVVFACVVLGLFYFVRIYNPLPDDEQMIEHFKAHRADFVEVVRRYRDYHSQPGKHIGYWFREEQEGDTRKIYKRAGIIRVRSEGVWLPDPYSIETAKKEREMMRRNPLLKFQYGTLKFELAPKSTYQRLHPLYGFIRKYYRFFPEVPRIENGELLGSMKPNGEYASLWNSSRVLPSLNRLSIPWKQYECVYRQIEPQWFIQMCRTNGFIDIDSNFFKGRRS